jgi:enamine deaminase RidA (YjgF/YER057c/UK114 family)
MITYIGGKQRYSDIVIHNNIGYLSGIVPIKTANIEPNIFEQTEEVLSLIDIQLAKVNSSKDNILSMNIFLANANDYDEMNKAFDKWVPKNKAPARATIGIVQFPNPLWKIEIVVIAVIPENK